MNKTPGLRKARACRGFTIFELMIALIIFTMAMNVGARLIHLTVRSFNETAEASRELKMQRQWLEMLRRDVWSAVTRSSTDGARLDLKTGDGRSIVWRQENGQLIRDADRHPAAWPIGKRPIRWTIGTNGILNLSDGESIIPLASPAIFGKGAP